MTEQITETKASQVDFHVHYTDETAEDILEEAKAKGVKAIALVGRVEYSPKIGEYVMKGREKGIAVLPAVEYSATIDDNFVDLIAIGFDPDNESVKKYFSQEANISDNRDKALRQERFLIDQGFTFQGLSEVYQRELDLLRDGQYSEKAIRFCRVVVENPQNYDLVANLINDNEELWQHTLKTFGNKPVYVDTPKALEAKMLYRLFFDFRKPGYFAFNRQDNWLEETVSAVHGAGGLILYSPEGKFNQDTWNKLIDKGVDGIMAWHGSQIEIPRVVIKHAITNDLLILGGSDYSPDKKDWQIGSGNNSEMYISLRRYKKLLEKLTK